jgi:hypothetical protein
LVSSELEVGDHLTHALEGDRSVPLEAVAAGQPPVGAADHLDAPGHPWDAMRLAVLPVSPTGRG